MAIGPFDGLYIARVDTNVPRVYTFVVRWLGGTPLLFATLDEAKKWVAAHYGPVVWKRTEIVWRSPEWRPVPTGVDA